MWLILLLLVAGLVFGVGYEDGGGLPAEDWSGARPGCEQAPPEIARHCQED